MAYTYQELLALPKLLSTVEAVKSGVPNPLPSEFFTLKEETIGDDAVYYLTVGKRTVAPRTEFNAPAKEVSLAGLQRRAAKTITSKIKLTIDPHVFMRLMDTTSYTHNFGVQEVARQVGELVVRQTNLEIAATAQVLANGVLYWDGNGDLLPTSSGAVTTATFDVPANNQNQLNGIISATWATASNDIPSMLRNLDQQARKLTGYPIWGAIYGANVHTYITNNNHYKEYLFRNARAQEEYLYGAGNPIPQGLWGLNWFPGYTMFYEDATGTNQTLIGADKVVFFPKPSEGWWKMIYGTTPVPSTIDVNNSLESSYRSIQMPAGMFAYAQASHDPVGLNMYVGNNFLPALKNPSVVFQATVAGF